MLRQFVFEDEVRKEWRLSRATLFRARRQGLEFRRIGARIAYVAEDLEKFFCQPRGLETVGAPEHKGRTNND